MALTPVSDLKQVLSGAVPPAGLIPDDPTSPAYYYMVTGSGATRTVVAYYYDPAAGDWVQSTTNSTAAANYSEGLVCGWEGKHNAKHRAVAHAEVALPCALTPRFSVAAVSASPIPFELWDTASGAPVVIASGVYPANAKFASAADCALVDASSAPVMAFAFSPSVSQPVAHYAAVPVGGHAAMPADGEGFFVHWSQVY